jgi:hypothetical protein
MFHLGWFMGSGFAAQTWALDPWAGNTGHDWVKGDLFVDLAVTGTRPFRLPAGRGHQNGRGRLRPLDGPEMRSRPADPAADAAHKTHRHRGHAVDEFLPPVHGGSDGRIRSRRGHKLRGKKVDTFGIVAVTKSPAPAKSGQAV